LDKKRKNYNLPYLVSEDYSLLIKILRENSKNIIIGYCVKKKENGKNIKTLCHITLNIGKFDNFGINGEGCTYLSDKIKEFYPTNDKEFIKHCKAVKLQFILPNTN